MAKGKSPRRYDEVIGVLSIYWIISDYSLTI